MINKMTDTEIKEKLNNAIINFYVKKSVIEFSDIIENMKSAPEILYNIPEIGSMAALEIFDIYMDCYSVYLDEEEKRKEFKKHLMDITNEIIKRFD